MCSSGLLKQTHELQLLLHVWNTFQQVGTSQRLWWPNLVMDIYHILLGGLKKKKKGEKLQKPPAKGHQRFETQAELLIILFFIV